MQTPYFNRPPRFALGALCLLLIPASLAYAGKEFRELRDADPQGSIEIVDVAGSIELQGWERPQVEVAGDAEDTAERVHIKTSGSRTTIHVMPSTAPGDGGSETRLLIHVPAKSAVFATLVSANLKVGGLLGDVNLRTVSGSLSGEVGGNLKANTATGSIRMTARAANSIEIKTINGNVQLMGGSGDVEVATVSGNAEVDLGVLRHGRFKTISGSFAAKLSLAPDAELEGESISGTLRFDFPSAPAARFDIQSFSGDIDNCFGPKPEKQRYEPGSRLEFKNGEGRAEVHIETKSGDVHLCIEGAHREAAGAAGVPRRDIFYVI